MYESFQCYHLTEIIAAVTTANANRTATRFETRQDKTARYWIKCLLQFGRNSTGSTHNLFIMIITNVIMTMLNVIICFNFDTSTSSSCYSCFLLLQLLLLHCCQWPTQIPANEKNSTTARKTDTNKQLLLVYVTPKSKNSRNVDNNAATNKEHNSVRQLDSEKVTQLENYKNLKKWNKNIEFDLR